MARHETRQVMEGGAVVIPKAMRDELGVEEGDHVEFEQRGSGEIVLRRGEAPPRHEGHGRHEHRDREGHGRETGVPPNEVQKSLRGIDFPAQKDDLLAQARENDAPGAVIDVIERFPEREYGGPQEVMKAFGEVSNEL